MPKNRLFRALVICVAVLAMLSCKKEKQADVAVVGDKVDHLAMESELHILALNGRIESGKNNPDIDWVTPFENATGCKLKATLVENSEILTANLASNDFDLVIATELSVSQDKSSPIEISRLRSFKELDKRFISSTEISSKLSLPFQWRLIKPVSPATEFVTEVESIHLMAKAKHINCAYAWMEWSLSPKLQGDIAAALGTIPVVPAACIGNLRLGDDACKQRMSETVEVSVEPAQEL